MSTSLRKVRTETRFNVLDRELSQQIQTFLQGQHFPAFRNLEIDVKQGLVTLSGKVSSFYEKQMAISTCQRVAGVTSLVDQVVVMETAAIS